MRGVEQREPRARDVVLDVLVRLGRRRWIVLAGNDEGWRFDLRQQFAVIHVAHGLAAGDIAFERRRGEHRLQPRDGLRRTFAESLGEPTLHVRWGERWNAFLAHELETVVPRGLVRKITGGVGEHESLDAL